jgi:hypothetical protein
MASLWTATDSRSVRQVAAQTEVAPTLATEGCNLDGVKSVQVTLRAPAGHTFTGVGSLLGYLWTGSQWDPCHRLDILLDGDANGDSSHPFPPIPVDHPRGRIAFVPSAIGLDSGFVGAITLDYSCVAVPPSAYGAPV